MGWSRPRHTALDQQLYQLEMSVPSRPVQGRQFLPGLIVGIAHVRQEGKLVQSLPNGLQVARGYAGKKACMSIDSAPNR